MPFYETHGDRPSKKFYFKSWARFQDPYFKINHDYSATIRESLRLLEYFLNSRSDCILPFSDLIKWKEHIILIEKDEICNMESKILEFHNNHNQESFKTLQHLNRKICCFLRLI